MTPINLLPYWVMTMPKYEVEGSPSDGYRIWFTDADGNVHEQESPPFHDPCEAWWWGFQRGIHSEIVTFELRPGNNCTLCALYAHMTEAEGRDVLNHQLVTYMAQKPVPVQHDVAWNGTKHSRIQIKANGHAARRKDKRKAQRAARKGK